VAAQRETVILACSACKRRNYTTTRNKRKNPNKLEIKKYCPFCRSHQIHKETR